MEVHGKEFYEKTEEFAKKIINLAAEERLTVRELCKSADIAKGISDNSTVEVDSIEKTDFSSQHISVNLDGKELFPVITDNSI